MSISARSPDEWGEAGTWFDLILRPEWHASAACRGRHDLDWFAVAAVDVRAARAVCARCTVRMQCATAGEVGQEIGLWGGQRRGADGQTMKQPGPVPATRPPAPVRRPTVPAVVVERPDPSILCSCRQRCVDYAAFRAHRIQAWDRRPDEVHELAG